MLHRPGRSLQGKYVLSMCRTNMLIHSVCCALHSTGASDQSINSRDEYRGGVLQVVGTL